MELRQGSGLTITTIQQTYLCTCCKVLKFEAVFFTCFFLRFLGADVPKVLGNRDPLEFLHKGRLADWFTLVFCCLRITIGKPALGRTPPGRIHKLRTPMSERLMTSQVPNHWIPNMSPCHRHCTTCDKLLDQLYLAYSRYRMSQFAYFTETGFINEYNLHVHGRL